MEYVSRVLLAAQYTGTNSAEVLALVQQVTQYTNNEWAIRSEVDGRLTLEETSPSGRAAAWPVDAGCWVVVATDFGIVARLPDEAFRARYRPLQDIILAAAQHDEVVERIAKHPKMQAEIKKKDEPGNGR